MTATTDDERAARPTVQVRLLGPVELVLDGAPVGLRRGRQQLLVAALALEAGRVRAAGRPRQRLAARRRAGPSRARCRPRPTAYGTARLCARTESSRRGRARLR